MTASPTDLHQRLTDHLTRDNQLGFGLLRPDLTFAQHTPNLGQFADPPSEVTPDMALTDLFWEFVGSEEALSAVIAGEQSHFRLENIWREGEPQPRYLTFECVLADPADPQQGLLLLVRDTTAEGRMEQQLVQERNELRLARAKLTLANKELQRLNQLKSLFLSMAAHDLRTPLTVIQGFAQIMMSADAEKMPAQFDEYLGAIVSQSEWLDRLIADVLSLNQIEEGELTLNSAEQDLNSLADEARNMMLNLSQAKNQTLTIETEQTPTYAYFDEERMRQVMYNLVGNAVKYTPMNGDIQIIIQETDVAAGFAVQDNGRGLSEAEVANLFQPYYRTDDAVKSRTKGSGLGLHIVNLLVDAHHGDIEVESTLGEGTRFTVWLPKSKEDYLDS